MTRGDSGYAVELRSKELRGKSKDREGIWARSLELVVLPVRVQV
jgi:hypothetical protein